ncbi:MAG: hypothetical protein E7394_03885 [Ruminococcaceae bacterium]|nr:hypothetical protein [Oscillospiraceae bacterium]
MKTIVPSYYKLFSCIADKCSHNCCLGWEIFIDDETCNLYTKTDSDFAKHISENIELTKDGARFRTDENKKCPFLSESGLCSIISEAGEKWLCEICRDHPRFRNCFSDRVEMGIGMCCEEAARLILLSDTHALESDVAEESGSLNNSEEKFFAQREWLFKCIDEENTPENIIKSIKTKYPLVSLCESPAYWYEFSEKLECMDKSGKKYFELMKDWSEFETPVEENDIKSYKNILSYYIYRHFPKVFEGYLPETCISFCLLCTSCIMHMSLKSANKSFETLCDISRVFSSEIEYSSENTEDMIDEIDFCVHSSYI